jgi:hypothetical protein
MELEVRGLTVPAVVAQPAQNYAAIIAFACALILIKSVHTA